MATTRASIHKRAAFACSALPILKKWSPPQTRSCGAKDFRCKSSPNGHSEFSREIVGGDHDPLHTYMVVVGHGFLIDLSRISGELWDQNNVASCA